MTFNNQLAIASVSLGMHQSHTLDQKIVAAAENQFAGIEIVFSDLENYSKSYSQSIITSAVQIKALCKTHGLSILSLNPLKNYEGHNSALSTRLETAKEWLEIARALGAKYLQVPSQFDTGNSSGNEEIAVRELKLLAELATEGDTKVSIAYEAVAWGSYTATWQQSRRIVELVDRENFGICLDAFHVLARLWGNNQVKSGKMDNADEEFKRSMEEFVTDCPMEKLFYIQLSDAEFYNPPLTPSHKFWSDNMDPRLIWSRNTRPFPLETEYNGYFPVVEFARACLVDKRYCGWVSFEIFDWRMRDEENGPDVAAKRGAQSWKRLTAALA